MFYTLAGQPPLGAGCAVCVSPCVRPHAWSTHMADPFDPLRPNPLLDLARRYAGDPVDQALRLARGDLHNALSSGPLVVNMIGTAGERCGCDSWLTHHERATQCRTYRCSARG